MSDHPDDVLDRPAFLSLRLEADLASARRSLVEAQAIAAAAPKAKRARLKAFVSAAALALSEIEAAIAEQGRRDKPGSVLPELRQHRDVDARPAKVGGSDGHRILTRLDALERAGKIGPAEVTAGETYRSAYEFGELGGQLGGLYSDGPSGGGCGVTARLDAVERLRLARGALTRDQRAAMDGLAEDVSWAELGRRMACEPDDARGVAVKALGKLADHYQLRGTGARLRSVRFAERAA